MSECAKCGHEMHVPVGYEPTEFCCGCAHDEIARLRSLSEREAVIEIEEANKDAAVMCEIAVAAAWRQFVTSATGICSARATGYRFEARFKCGGHTADEKRRLADELDQVAAAIRALSPKAAK